MHDFMWGLLYPPFLASLVIITAVILTLILRLPLSKLPKSFLRQHFFRIWRLAVAFNIFIYLMLFSFGAITGTVVSGVLCLLLDDDMRKKGKRAASLLGDKTRQIFESMRERMRVLQPLPGLSSFR